MNSSICNIPGVIVVTSDFHRDHRGHFVKPFSSEVTRLITQPFSIEEVFYSVSQQNVIRGMHFQTPPWEVAKLVYVTAGEIMDVVLDLRIGSPTYGKHVAVELTAENGKVIFVPKGCAHGFLSQTGGATVAYLQSGVYAPGFDSGIHFDSFGFDWHVDEPIVSSRDDSFASLRQYITPFVFNQERKCI